MSEEPSRRGAANRTLEVVRRVPFTILFVLVFFVTGAVSGSLFTPASELPWFPRVATGLPAFEEGKWWTVFTSPLFLEPPYAYLVLFPLLAGGLGWCEWRFGAWRTILIFIGGHLVGVLGAAAVVALIAPSGWPWAEHLASTLDLGPSCGAIAALVFAIATLPSPWRLRARIAIVLWALISLLYLGRLYDLEHAITMFAALLVTGLLPAFRRPAGRPTEREWRLLVFSGVIAVGVIQVLDLVVPYSGPLGENHPIANASDVAIDVVVIALIANGIRRGYRIAWIATLALGIFNLVGSAFLGATLPLLVELGFLESPTDVLGQIIAPSVLWAAILILAIAARGAFRVRLRRGRRIPAGEPLTRDELVEQLQRHGGGTISWMTTWRENRRLAIADGAVAYQAHAGVAIMLGDPIVPAEAKRDALEGFARAAQVAGLVPCAFSTSGDTEQAKPEGWRSTIVADDTIVDLPGLEFRGKPWGAVRTAMNRAERENITFRMVTLADEPWNVLAQVRAISEQWTGDKGLPEMRFTLGTVEEALDPEVRVAVAVDDEGNLHGVTSWLPVYGNGSEDGGRIVGWTLDLMRRRDGGFGPVMEFLIGAALRHFSYEGYEFASLSGAPLANASGEDPTAVDQVLERLGTLLEPLYGFQSLHRFKQKFNPRHQPLYLLYRDEGDLPRIGIALTRAYLPDASMRDLLASATATGDRS